MKTIASKIRQAMVGTSPSASTADSEDHPNFWMYR